MKLGKNATLAGGAIFVIAASIFIGTIEQEPLPVEVANSLTLRPALYLARVAPLPEEDAAGLDLFNQTTIDLLAEVAGKPLPGRRDRLAGAAASAAVGAKHLVPLFIGELADSHPAARVLLRWSLDPSFKPGPAELNILRTIDTDQAYEELAVTAVMAGSGRELPETTLRLERRSFLEILSFLVILLVPTLIIWGTVSWIRWRKRQFAEALRERPPPDLQAMRGPLEVYVWFMVLFLSSNLLLPRLLDRTDLTVAGQLLVSYLTMALGGLAIAVTFGVTDGERDWLTVLGFRKTPGGVAPAGLGASLTGGIKGYAMIWPIVLIATMVSNIFGGGGSGLQDPLEQYLVSGASPVDRMILIASAVVVAPFFEEILFRGFFYRRLRAVLTPYGAAAVSGFVFAAAHFSAAGFLQIWAIGFTLGLTYEQTGRLRSSMIAHGLWNLGTILSVIFFYG